MDSMRLEDLTALPQAQETKFCRGDVGSHTNPGSDSEMPDKGFNIRC